LADLVGTAVPEARVESLVRLDPMVLRDPPDLVVFREPFSPCYAGFLRSIRRQWRETAIFGVLCKGWDDGATWLSALLDQLDEFISCPFRDADLIARVRRLLRRRATVRNSAGGEALIGHSPAFLALVRKLPAITRSDATVIITGETGTGKELFARAVHYKSARGSRPFVPVNCGTLPDHLFENEMFGHAKGAFTDASTSEKGLVEVAASGTVLLDEIDTLSFWAQSKLLRFLQNGEYRPLGSSETLHGDVRVIAATNANLRQRVAEKLFREDVFHRLNVLSVEIPPLRERLPDIPVLAQHFLTRFARQYNREALRLSGGAIEKMMGYAWPGNVRELESMIHRAVVLSETDTLEAASIELPGTDPSALEVRRPMQSAKSSAVATFERTYLINLLTVHKGNLTHAARAAGQERRSLQRLVRKHGLERTAFAG
jgi:DNA-binding NtrC family response regulator